MQQSQLGYPQNPPTQPYQPGYPQYPSAQQSQYMLNVSPPLHDRSGFAQLLYSVGSSGLFLTGIILYSLGSLLGVFASLNSSSIFAFAVVSLPIVGLWLMYAASKSPWLPNKTQPAITLFKISAIITFVGECIMVFILVIVAIVLIIVGIAAGYDSYSSYESVLINVIAIVLLISAIVALVISIIYFKSILRLLAGIKSGMQGNPVYELPGIRTYTVLTCIMIGAVLLGTIISFVTLSTISGDVRYYMYSALYDLPSEIRSIIEPFINGFGISLVVSSISSVVAYVGSLILVIALNRFNPSFPGVHADSLQTLGFQNSVITTKCRLST
jgi:MFS family permease